MELSDLPKGLSWNPPASPWGINFGGGVDSTTVVDSVVLFGTLKEKPAKLPPVISVHWLQDGVIADRKIAEVAA